MPLVFPRPPTLLLARCRAYSGMPTKTAASNNRCLGKRQTPQSSIEAYLRALCRGDLWPKTQWQSRRWQRLREFSLEFLVSSCSQDDDTRQASLPITALALNDGQCRAQFPRLAYSYRSASIGFSREAFRAGKKPETIPTSDRIVNEMIITPIEACRKIAPSWSAVL
jgi:hypothetical protein